jgi:hypothetical protein
VRHRGDGGAAGFAGAEEAHFNFVSCCVVFGCWFGLVWIQSGGCFGWGLVWCDSARCLALAFVRFLEIETAFGMDWILLCVGQTRDEMRYLLGIDCNEMTYVRLLD